MQPRKYVVNFIRDIDGDQKYARLENGSEYYPETGQHAVDRYGKPRYTRDMAGNITYPIDWEGNEFYFKDGDGDYVHPGVQGLKYARRFLIIGTNLRPEDIYPVTRMENHEGVYEKIEVPINNRYARNRDAELYYPLGFSGHEYFFPDEGHPTDYPLANNGNYLVPLDADTWDIVENPYSLVKITKENLLKTVPVTRLSDTHIVEHYLTEILARDRTVRTLEGSGGSSSTPNKTKKTPKPNRLPFNFFWIATLWVVLLACLAVFMKRK